MRLWMLTVLVSGLFLQGAHAQPASVGQVNTANDLSCTSDPSWTAPQQPVRIYGNTWHVGPPGLAVLLITSPAGNVLIDGGVPGYESLIEANLRSLGIRLRDIKWILSTHAHCDHAGGIAQLARDTGAAVIAGAADAPSLERGGHDDLAYGDRFLFPSVQVNRTVTDGERLHLVDIGSLSAPGYQLIGNAKYPGIVREYQHSFAVVAALPCDIALAPHPEIVDFWQRVARREQGDADALIDPAGCRAYAKDARESFEAKLAKQRADATAAK